MSELNIGDSAPGFALQNQNGELVNLADLRGKKVVLYFYPKALTPGCTAQACGLRDIQSELAARNAVAYGISPDPQGRLKKFVEKYLLTFDLLSDCDHKIAEKYGVWAPKKFLGREFLGVLRKTFIISESGEIAHIAHKVNTRTHHQDVLTWIAASSG